MFLQLQNDMCSATLLITWMLPVGNQLSGAVRIGAKMLAMSPAGSISNLKIKITPCFIYFDSNLQLKCHTAINQTSTVVIKLMSFSSESVYWGLHPGFSALEARSVFSIRTTVQSLVRLCVTRALLRCSQPSPTKQLWRPLIHEL